MGPQAVGFLLPCRGKSGRAGGAGGRAGGAAWSGLGSGCAVTLPHLLTVIAVGGFKHSDGPVSPITPSFPFEPGALWGSHIHCGCCKGEIARHGDLQTDTTLHSPFGFNSLEPSIYITQHESSSCSPAWPHSQPRVGYPGHHLQQRQRDPHPAFSHITKYHLQHETPPRPSSASPWGLPVLYPTPMKWLWVKTCPGLLEGFANRGQCFNKGSVLCHVKKFLPCNSGQKPGPSCPSEFQLHAWGRLIQAMDQGNASFQPPEIHLLTADL